jgi:CRP-like cAMP-binding protein
MFRRDCNMTRVRLLKTFPLFSACSVRQLSRVDSLTSDLQVEPRCVLTHTGRPGHEFFIVMSGTATVWSHDVALDRLGPGSFFGELALIFRRNRAATVVADSDMALLVMSAQEFWSPHFLIGPVKDAIFAAAAERQRTSREVPGGSVLPGCSEHPIVDLPGISSVRDGQDQACGLGRENVTSQPR